MIVNYICVSNIANRYSKLPFEDNYRFGIHFNEGRIIELVSDCFCLGVF